MSELILASTPAAWFTRAKAEGASPSVDQFLDDVAALGYNAVEISGGTDRLGPAKEFQKKLADRGLQLCAWQGSVTVIPHPPNTEQYQKAMREAAEFGASHIMICGGFLPNNRRNTYTSDYDGFAENLGRATEFAKSCGLELSYHPHRGCIVETAEETQFMIDRLPDLKLCVDTAHLESSGDDPVAFINRFGDRITHTHLKDYDAESLKFMPLGTANVDLDACFDALEDADYAGAWCVELDGNAECDPRETAETSLRYMQKRLSVPQ